MEIKNIKLQNLTLNEWNPNQMQSNVFDHLTETIEDMGFLQPILVWEKPSGEHLIIDGEHRVKAEKNLGKKEVEAKVLTSDDLFTIGKRLAVKQKINFSINQNNDETLKAIAKTLTVLMNDIKGESDPVKFAHLLDGLKPVFTIDQLSEVLNKSEQELESYKLLLDEEEKDVKSAMKVITDKEEIQLNEIKLFFNVKQLEIYEKTKAEFNLNDTETVLRLCEDYLTRNNIEYSKETETNEEDKKDNNR